MSQLEGSELGSWVLVSPSPIRNRPLVTTAQVTEGAPEKEVKWLLLLF